MINGVLVDPETRQIEALRLSEETFMADVKTALGCSHAELGANLPGGAKIYSGGFAMITSPHYFRHILATAALPGRGVIVGDWWLRPYHVRPAVDFVSREEAYAELQHHAGPPPRPYDLWRRTAEEGRPGISITCRGVSCRLPGRSSDH